MSVSSVGSSLGVRSMMTRVPRENGNSLRTSSVRGQVNRRVTFKKPKKIVVSRKFREKVTKALLPASGVGRWRETDMQPIQKLSAAEGGLQKAFEVGNDGGAGIGLAYFTPGEVLNAASVMFNDKVNTRNGKLNTSGGLPDFGSASFDPRIAKVEVLSSNVTVTFKNNQVRTIIMQLYECSPKSKTNFLTYSSPFIQWAQNLGNESSVGLPSGPINIAIPAASPQTLYQSPLDCKLLRANFNIEKHDIIMDPGQTYDHVMQGPVGMYDFQKFWKSDSLGTADEFINMQPSKSRYLFATFRNDLVSTGVNDYGRLGDGTAGGLLMETTRRFVIKAPELTGGTTTILAANFVNDNRRDVYYAKNWALSAVAGDNRVDPTDGRDNL